MTQKLSQKTWLTAAKRNLANTRKGLTWDAFANLVGVEPRTFKTYRMPEDSTNFRRMPALVINAIEALLKTPSEESVETEVPPTTMALLVPALAALVIRQARVSLIEGRMIAGTNRAPNVPVGLSPEDRKAMALVSATCLRNGLNDHGSEIHNLLWLCTKPLGKWLAIPEVLDSGLEHTCLVQPDEGIPTAEAEELSARFTGITAGLEEQLFQRFMVTLARFPETRANEYYSSVREYIVKHPIVSSEDFRSGITDLPAQIWVILQQEFYESVPESWEVGGGVPLCDHCGNAMRQGKVGLICRTVACDTSAPSSSSTYARADDLMRVKRGIKQYWVEPGLDEIRLFDAVRELELDVSLYPFQDRVDIAVGEIGMDLKAYSSPETLGRKFNRSIGGLAHYPRKWVVIPDYLLSDTPSYLDRLQATLNRDDLLCLTVSNALKTLKRETKGGAHA